MDDNDPLFTLCFHLIILSLLAIGGLATILPELHRVVVEVEGWMSDGQFTSLFALSQAAPGPNMLFVTTLGWHLGGVGGALLATLCFCGPPILLAYAVARLANRWGALGWFRIVQESLIPLTAGLMVASALLLSVAAAGNWVGYAITGATAALVLTRPRINPLWAFGAAALIGMAGFV